MTIFGAAGNKSAGLPTNQPNAMEKDSLYAVKNLLNSHIPILRKMNRKILILPIILLLIPWTFASEPETPDHLSGEEIRLGERIFYGLVEGKGIENGCVQCHNTREIDTLNWNPSAYEIALKFKDKSTEDLAKAVLSPATPTMTAMHNRFQLNEEDIALIKGFLDHVAETGLVPQKPVITRLLIFLFLGLIITLLLVDLIFTHKIKYRAIHFLVIVSALGIQFLMVHQEARALGRQQGYAPNQPVKFSHKVHALENKIDCQYCHNTAEVSKSANIPSVSTCMNCHILVREGSRSGRYEIDKVVQAAQTGTPIEWIRVHNLPDHVFFSHAQHVGVAKLDCAECHGLVEGMDIVKQVSDLSMGWCLDCHRTRQVDFDDNRFYEQYEKLHEDLKSGKLDKVTVETLGGTECMKCHY